MSRVTFKFQNGKERKMHPFVADVLTRRGLGTYMTRDLVADRPKIIYGKTPVVGTIVSTEEFDSAGDAWNPELHVATKLQNKDGTWRKRPGAAAAETEQDAE